MATKKRYQIKLHNLITARDLPSLPSELKKDFLQYQKVLSLSPYQTKGIPSHNLMGEKSGKYGDKYTNDAPTLLLLSPVFSSNNSANSHRVASLFVSIISKSNTVWLI